MGEEKKIDTVMVQRGNYYLGRSTRASDGSITQSTQPRWEPNPDGSAVVVCAYDNENDKPIGTGDLFPIWDSVGIDRCVRDKLALTRRNFPAPEELYELIKKWDDRSIDLCEDICCGYDCRVCPIQDLKDGG